MVLKLRDNARLVPCGSHLWAMQPRWSTATIEIHPYKDPCHCNNILVTLITVVSNPIGLLWYQKQITCEAAGQDYLTDNPAWEHYSQGHYNCVVMEICPS